VWHALSHTDAGVREQALHRMAALATPQDVPRMAALLDDDDPQVRLAAATALAQLPFLDERTIDSLRRDGQSGRAELVHALAERQWEQATA
jgi:HEAT repeat protein